jgi:hypothetical protein
VLAVAMILLMTVLTFGASLACWGVSIPPVLAMVEPLAEKLGESHVTWQRQKRETAAQKAAAAKAAAATPGPPDPTATAPISEAPAADPNPIILDPAAPSAPADPTSPSDPAADPAIFVSPNTVVTMNGVVISNTPASSGLVIPADEDWWRRYGDADWAQSGEPKAVIAASGWTSAVNWSGLKWLVISLPVGFLFGVIFSVLLLGQSRWKSLLIIPVVFALSTCWAYIDKLDDSSQWGGQIEWMAADLAGFPLHLIVFLFMAYAMSMGIWSGRAIARGFVRLMLPPRLCGSLADLWLCDGKTPPYGEAAMKLIKP